MARSRDNVELVEPTIDRHARSSIDRSSPSQSNAEPDRLNGCGAEWTGWGRKLLATALGIRRQSCGDLHSTKACAMCGVTLVKLDDCQLIVQLLLMVDIRGRWSFHSDLGTACYAARRVGETSFGAWSVQNRVQTFDHYNILFCHHV